MKPRIDLASFGGLNASFMTREVKGAPVWLWGLLGGTVVLGVWWRLSGQEKLDQFLELDRPDSKSIDDLHPAFQPLAREWKKRMDARGVVTRFDMTARSLATQQRLYDEGRSKVTTGWHNFGLAFDFLPRSSSGWKYPDGSGSALDNEIMGLLKIGGVEGEKLGMTWGGRWGWDHFHLEWHPNLTVAKAEELQRTQGLDFAVV